MWVLPPGLTDTSRSPATSLQPHLQFLPERPLASICPSTSFPKGVLTPRLFKPHPSVFLSLPGPSSICPPHSVKAEVLQGSVLGPLSSCSVLCADNFLQGHHVPWMHLYPPMCTVFTLSSSPRLKTQPNLTVNAQHYLLPPSSQESSPGTWKPFSVLTVRKPSVPLPSWPPEGHPHGPCHQGHHPTYFQMCYHYSLLKFSTAIVFFS